MGKKILSIIVTVYNNEKYIEKCLKSIGNFDKNNIEVIIVNDGSKDNSREIIKKLNINNQYKYIEQSNGGVSRARNRGIQEANGEYLWFIDGDDFIERDSINKILQELKVYPETEVLYFGINYYDKNYNFLGKDLVNHKNYYEKGILFNSPCNKIYKKVFLENYDVKFCETFDLGEDMNFNFKVFSNTSKIKVIQEKLYNYYRSGISTTSKLERRKEIFQAFDDLILDLLRSDKFEKIKEILEEYYIQNCIENLYRLIILSDLTFFKKIKNMKEIDKKINERVWYFNKKYKYIRLKLKLKYYRRYLKQIILK